MQVCFLDHYDSFSFNLIDWLFSDTGIQLVYCPHDSPGLAEKLRRTPMPLVLSPGPKDPFALPGTLQIIEEQLYKVPILGICLGHQCLGVALGGTIARAQRPFHGTSQALRIDPASAFLREVPRTSRVARYNSLLLEKNSLPLGIATAWNDDDEIEALEDYSGTFPALGLQFHPESFMSTGMESLKRFWLQLVIEYYRRAAEA